jgi:hypothetical protein
MSYIDQSDYKSLLNKFAQGTQKQMLQENYIDLRPINSLAEYSSPMVMSTNDAKYAGSMEEAEGVGMNSVKNGFDKNPKVTKADFIPAAKKNEGLYGDSQSGMRASGPTIQTVEGHSLGNLSLEERTELKNYVDSIKTTKKAIQELLAKAKAPKMEGGNMTNLTRTLDSDQQQPTQTPGQDQETF